MKYFLQIPAASQFRWRFSYPLATERFWADRIRWVMNVFPGGKKVLATAEHILLGSTVLFMANSLFTRGLSGLLYDVTKYFRGLPFVNALINLVLRSEVKVCGISYLFFTYLYATYIHTYIHTYAYTYT